MCGPRSPGRYRPRQRCWGVGPTSACWPAPDAQLAAFYHRLMTTQRHCHTQATIAVARKLAERTRVTITTGRPYQLRDTNGDPVTARGAKELIDAHYHVDTRTHPHNRAHTDTMQNSKPAR